MVTPERRVHVIGAGTPAPDHLKDTPAGNYVNAIRGNFPPGGEIVIFEVNRPDEPQFQYGILETPVVPLDSLEPVFQAELDHLEGGGTCVFPGQMPRAVDFLNHGLGFLSDIDD